MTQRDPSKASDERVVEDIGESWVNSYTLKKSIRRNGIKLPDRDRLITHISKQGRNG
jgi:hypothetical protein